MARGGDIDGTTHVIDTTTGDSIYIYDGNPILQVYALAWSPDSTRIASGGSVAYINNEVKVFTATTGGNTVTHAGYNESTPSIAWSPDGKRVASGGSKEPIVATSGCSPLKMRYCS